MIDIGMVVLISAPAPWGEGCIVCEGYPEDAMERMVKPGRVVLCDTHRIALKAALDAQEQPHG